MSCYESHWFKPLFKVIVFKHFRVKAVASFPLSTVVSLDTFLSLLAKIENCQLSLILCIQHEPQQYILLEKCKIWNEFLIVVLNLLISLLSLFLLKKNKGHLICSQLACNFTRTFLTSLGKNIILDYYPLMLYFGCRTLDMNIISFSVEVTV